MVEETTYNMWRTPTTILHCGRINNAMPSGEPPSAYCTAVEESVITSGEHPLLYCTVVEETVLQHVDYFTTLLYLT